MLSLLSLSGITCGPFSVHTTMAPAMKSSGGRGTCLSIKPMSVRPPQDLGTEARAECWRPARLCPLPTPDFSPVQHRLAECRPPRPLAPRPGALTTSPEPRRPRAPQPGRCRFFRTPKLPEPLLRWSPSWRRGEGGPGSIAVIRPVCSVPLRLGHGKVLSLGRVLVF